MAYKSVQFKVFAPGCRSSQLFTLKPVGKRTYTKAGVEEAKRQFSTYVAQNFTWSNYTMIPVGPNKFNLIPDCANA